MLNQRIEEQTIPEIPLIVTKKQLETMINQTTKPILTSPCCAKHINEESLKLIDMRVFGLGIKEQSEKTCNYIATCKYQQIHEMRFAECEQFIISCSYYTPIKKESKDN